MLIDEAIVLAAGLGTRLQELMKDTHKSLLKIGKIPLIAYPLANLANVGVNKFYIVVNQHNYENVEKLVSKMRLDAEFIVNETPERGNGYSLILGMKHVRDRLFYLCMSDHIHHPRIFKKFSQSIKKIEADIVVCVDSNPVYVGINESTKVMMKNATLTNIGKNLTEYTHVDTGLFAMKKSLYGFFDRFCRRVHEIEVSKLVKQSITKGFKVLGVDIMGDPWMDVDTVKDMNKLKTTAKEFVKHVIDQLINYIQPLTR